MSRRPPYQAALLTKISLSRTIRMKLVRWLLLAAIPVLAQTPRVVNAKFETRPATQSLDAILRAAPSPSWVGYAVPRVPGRGRSCWYDYRGRAAGPAGYQSAVPAEGRSTLMILFRINNAQVESIRTFTADCEVDAGGLPFLWLTGVKPADSLALLAARTTESHRSPISTIAQHADEGANRLLTGYLSTGQPEDVRRNAAYWMAAARGPVWL